MYSVLKLGVSYTAVVNAHMGEGSVIFIATLCINHMLHVRYKNHNLE